MKSFEIGARHTRVYFLHGLRGHGLSQQPSLQHMAKNLGVTMTALEMDGHGEESVIRHCLVPQYRHTVEDICALIKQQTMEAEQVIMMGYSFGASLMILAAEQLSNDLEFKPKVAGIIGISSAFDVAHNVPRWQLALSQAIGPVSRYLFENSSRFSPILTIQEMDIDRISPDKTVVKAIANDPLMYKGRIPLATSAQVYLAGVAARKSIDKISIPTLLLHSRDDSIALAPRPESFAAHVQLRLFSKLRHNCIDGVSREVVAARHAMMQFIVEKL
jgi:alpha-beta hydrolase superfamily lysophospholipase